MEHRHRIAERREEYRERLRRERDLRHGDDDSAPFLQHMTDRPEEHSRFSSSCHAVE